MTKYIIIGAIGVISGIDNWGQKVLTIALAWAVPCGAAWAIIPMLSTVFFGAGAPLVVVALLLVMILHIFFRAEVLRRQLQGLQPRRVQRLYAEKRGA